MSAAQELLADVRESFIALGCSKPAAFVEVLRALKNHYGNAAQKFSAREYR